MVFDADISGFGETRDNLDDLTNTVVAEAEVGSRQEAEELLQKIQQTAPVDEGTYKEDWRIEERPNDPRGDLFIVNSVDHGPYLVFPNERMKGSSAADDPARGIIHNVRGIVHNHKSEYQTNLIDRIKEALFG